MYEYWLLAPVSIVYEVQHYLSESLDDDWPHQLGRMYFDMEHIKASLQV